jgi:hypothetical protein
MSQLKIVRHAVIQRAPEVVRAHFLDFDHHIAHGVHKGVAYTVLERHGAQQRVRSQFRVYGLPKTDEIIVYQDDDGAVVQDFVHGDFAGGRIRVSFAPAGTGTRVTATLDVPLRGVNRLLRPLLERVVGKLTTQAIEEDRIDMEQHGYQPPSAARQRLSA